ncbi:hemophore-related protein [[Mycobacterium] burgundiense]|uniref:Hemophore-related protein n=1 Tax=[Mycobacterium] burgundiense TaxID=3064286 RepID=A0ABM9LMA2_9MYCO|nr:hemophore-related protein [Mycolicibacterium sp. MU0053]CAJ1501471.1 hemophore-related protein [Mycolicibacterium sp. MU0053]
MIQLSLTRVAAAVGGLVLSLAAGAGVASAAPDLGPAIDTTCSYPQLVSALNAQDPQVGKAFSQMPMLQNGLRNFIAAGPQKRAEVAQHVAAAPAFQPYLGTIEQAFVTCHNF